MKRISWKVYLAMVVISLIILIALDLGWLKWIH